MSELIVLEKLFHDDQPMERRRHRDLFTCGAAAERTRGGVELSESNPTISAADAAANITNGFIIFATGDSITLAFGYFGDVWPIQATQSWLSGGDRLRFVKGRLSPQSPDRGLNQRTKIAPGK